MLRTKLSFIFMLVFLCSHSASGQIVTHYCENCYGNGCRLCGGTGGCKGPKDAVMEFQLCGYCWGMGYMTRKSDPNQLGGVEERCFMCGGRKGQWVNIGTKQEIAQREKQRKAKEAAAERQRIAEEKERERQRIAEEKERERQRIAEEEERERQRIAAEKARKEEQERQRIAEEKFVNTNTSKANAGNLEAQYQLSMFYLQKHNRTEAIKWLEKCAQQNYKDSPKTLGICYYQWGFKHYEEAIPWLEVAAKQGDGESQFALGKIYMGQQKHNQARVWLEAARENQSGVSELLHNCYIKLVQEASQPSEAESWYKKAMQINTTQEDIRGLAKLYYENGDYGQAEEQYLSLKELSSADKMTLGLIYEKYALSATSTKDKISWTEKEFELSSSQMAKNQLQNLYVEYGDECKNNGDFVTAVDAYQSGTNYGSLVARYKLANMYEKGQGGVKSKEIALALHKENADAGYKPSRRKLVYGSGFLLFESAFSNSPKASFGFSAGGVRKVGGYMKMRFANLALNDMVSMQYALKEYPDRTKWTEKDRLFSMTYGMLFRLGCPLHLNVGIGYGKRVQMYKLGEDTETKTSYNEEGEEEVSSTTTNICVEKENSTIKGMSADLGFLLYLKHFSLRAGVSTIKFKHTDVEIGLGFNFGKK